MENLIRNKLSWLPAMQAKRPLLANLRQRAEEILRDSARKTVVNTGQMSPEELRWVIDELRVYQVELEIQNDELQQAQVELDAAREHYFELYDLAPVGYCTLSLAGLILRANLTAACFLGVSRETLVNQPLSQYILRQDQDIYYQHRRLLFDSGQPQMCELRMVGSDGGTRWVRLDANVTRDEDSLATCRVTLTDITRTKQVEEQNSRMEAQYRQMQKMDSLGRLASGVAHDFNNKLTVIRGGLEILMENQEVAEVIAPDLVVMRDAAEDAVSLIRQLLGFARRQTIEVREINCNGTCHRILATLRRLLGANITLSWQPADDLWPVRMDPSQIDQIITNLCVNGGDAISGAGSITIATANRILLEADCVDPLDFVPGDYVELMVSDTGCGIDPESLDKIFEPFFSTKDADRGSGLGLATVYGIVKQNRGLIDVHSQLGVGTTFSVFLPRAPGSVSAAAPPTESLHMPGGNETILVVEDEPSILTMTVRMLTDLGYTVLGAHDPKEALAAVAELAAPIDLVITDVMMPGMNGLDLVLSLLSSNTRLQALFITGYTFPDELVQSMLPITARYLIKPFTKVELAATVRQALQSRA